jgi:putative mRNA 3-end processing factor
MPPQPDGLLTQTQNGLYCPAGDFFIDPSGPVQRAIVTHAHADHARPGSDAYLSTVEGEAVLRYRLPDSATIQTVEYGETITCNGVKISLHPAGHVRGSAQVRLEHNGDVWVVTGDYKRADDATTTSFETVSCDVFITECTFGLPVYRWPPADRVFDQINRWWQRNQDEGVTSVLFAYSFGKAQRVLMGIDPSIGPIYTHGAVENINHVFCADGVDLPPTTYVDESTAPDDWSQSLVIAPSSASSSNWLDRFDPISTGFASGWMRIRGRRRRRAVDRGFILSDHVDWPNLTQTVRETGAHTVWATHGYNEIFARWLRDQDIAEAYPLPLRRLDT